MSDALSSAPSAPAGPASANDAQLTGRFAEEAKHGYQEMRPSSNGLTYAQSLGIDANTFSHLMATNPIMRHSSFRRMMYDAAAGSLARKQLATHRQQNRAQVPPVTRPGNGALRTTAQSANLQALSQKLNVTGGAREAADLLIAMRNSKRRG
jgi:hypothetical protein